MGTNNLLDFALMPPGSSSSSSATSSAAACSQVNFAALAKCECSEYAVSDYVEAKWNDGQWFRATITGVSNRGKYDLSYDSGEDEAAVSAHLLRRPLARFGGKWPVFVVTRRDESRLFVEPLLLGTGGRREAEWRPERSVRYLVSHERGAAFSSAKAAKKRKNRYSGIRKTEKGWEVEGLEEAKHFGDEISAARARDWIVLESGGGSELNFQDSLIWHAASKAKDHPARLEEEERDDERSFLVAPRSKKARTDGPTLPTIGEALAECAADVLWQPVASSSEATDVESYLKDAALRFGGGEAAALLAYRRKSAPGEKNELTTPTPPVLASSLPPSLATSLWSTSSAGPSASAHAVAKRDKKKDLAYEAAVSACKPKHRPRPTIVNGNRVLAGEQAPKWEHLAQHLNDYPDWRLEPGLAPPVFHPAQNPPSGGNDPRIAAARDAALEALRNLDEAARRAAHVAWTYYAALSVFEDATCCESVDAAALEAAKSLGALGAALFDLKHPKITPKTIASPPSTLLTTSEPPPAALPGVATVVQKPVPAASSPAEDAVVTPVPAAAAVAAGERSGPPGEEAIVAPDPAVAAAGAGERAKPVDEESDDFASTPALAAAESGADDVASTAAVAAAASGERAAPVGKDAVVVPDPAAAAAASGKRAEPVGKDAVVVPHPAVAAAASGERAEPVGKDAVVVPDPAEVAATSGERAEPVGEDASVAAEQWGAGEKTEPGSPPNGSASSSVINMVE